MFSTKNRGMMKDQLKDLETKGILWKPAEHCHELTYAVGDFPDDGMLFYKCFQPTCQRRGQWRLFIRECADVENRIKWGCFDNQDQPVRYYHHLSSLDQEATAIAMVLLTERIELEEEKKSV